MSRPRQIVPEQFYLLTRRCAQRQLLMRPDDATTNAFIYCLALAASRFAVDVLFTLAEGNHHHTVIFDRAGNVSAFAEYFHKLFARSQNALRGRCENFWAAQQCSLVRLLDPETVVDKIVYSAINPVKDLLVERVHQWPGASAYNAFMRGGSLRATRPRHFFRKTGALPEHVELPLTLPPALGDATYIRDRVREAIEATERSVKETRLRSGKQILGRRAVLSQSWKTIPDSVEPRRTLRPQFAGPRHVRIHAVATYRSFLDAYRRARQLMLAGGDAVFPPGTYQLARLMNVRVEAPRAVDECVFWLPAASTEQRQVIGA